MLIGVGFYSVEVVKKAGVRVRGLGLRTDTWREKEGKEVIGEVLVTY